MVELGLFVITTYIVVIIILSILGSIFMDIGFFIKEKIEDIKYYFKNR